MTHSRQSSVERFTELNTKLREQTITYDDYVSQMQKVLELAGREAKVLNERHKQRQVDL